MSKNRIDILLNAVFDAETVSFDLSDERENLVFVMGPRASKVNPGLYARKALHLLAEGRYLADQQR
ncbi:MAG TPA: hypothetical protein VM848_12430 [Acidimicrobiia bacterium]|nr:hypothetical protein [Acidimicrobiia bacterium]